MSRGIYDKINQQRIPIAGAQVPNVDENIIYNSPNPVAGGAVYNTVDNIYNAMNNITNSFIYDSTPTEGSSNMINSGVIYTTVNQLQANFQVGCDSIVGALTAKGVTPTSNNLYDITNSINNIVIGDNRFPKPNIPPKISIIKSSSSIIEKSSLRSQSDVGKSWTLSSSEVAENSDGIIYPTKYTTFGSNAISFYSEAELFDIHTGGNFLLAGEYFDLWNYTRYIYIHNYNSSNYQLDLNSTANINLLGNTIIKELNDSFLPYASVKQGNLYLGENNYYLESINITNNFSLYNNIILSSQRERIYNNNLNNIKIIGNGMNNSAQIPIAISFNILKNPNIHFENCNIASEGVYGMFCFSNQTTGDFQNININITNCFINCMKSSLFYQENFIYNNLFTKANFNNIIIYGSHGLGSIINLYAFPNSSSSDYNFILSNLTFLHDSNFLDTGTYSIRLTYDNCTFKRNTLNSDNVITTFNYYRSLNFINCNMEMCFNYLNKQSSSLYLPLFSSIGNLLMDNVNILSENLVAMFRNTNMRTGIVHSENDIGFYNINIPNATNLAYMFYDFTPWDARNNAQPFKFSEFNINFNNVQSVYQMFNFGADTRNLDFSNYNFIPLLSVGSFAGSIVPYNGGYFGGYINLSNTIFDNNISRINLFNQGTNKYSNIIVNITNMDISKVNSMYQFFNNFCGDIIGIETLNTINVTNMQRTFYNKRYNNVNNGSIINLSSWNVSNVQSMWQMFSLGLFGNLNLSNWNACNVQSIFEIFNGTHVYNNIFMNNWNLSNVTNMYRIFNRFDYNYNLDLSNWNVCNLSEINQIFNYVTLPSINLANWNIDKVNKIYCFFENCFNLKTINLSNWNFENVDYIGSFIKSSPNINQIYMDNNIYFGNKLNDKLVTIFDFVSYTNISSLDTSHWNCSKIRQALRMFSHCSNLKTLDTSNWDMSNCTDFSNMFSYCNLLTNINVSKWNVGMYNSNIDTSSMFQECQNIITLDLSNWNMNNIRSSSYMFANCRNLKTIYYNPSKLNFNLNHIGSNAFLNCTNLVGPGGSYSSSLVNLNAETVARYFTPIEE